MNEAGSAPQDREKAREGSEEQPRDSYTSAAEEEKQRLLAELEAHGRKLAAQRAMMQERRGRRLLISIVVAVTLAALVIAAGYWLQSRTTAPRRGEVSGPPR